MRRAAAAAFAALASLGAAVPLRGDRSTVAAPNQGVDVVVGAPDQNAWGLSDFIVRALAGPAGASSPLRRLGRRPTEAPPSADIASMISSEERTLRPGRREARWRSRLVPYIAAARSAYRTPLDAFDAVDTDQNGNICHDEWMAESVKLKLDHIQFHDFDLNQNTDISKDEFLGAVAKQSNVAEFRDSDPEQPLPHQSLSNTGTAPLQGDWEHARSDARSAATCIGAAARTLAVTSVLAFVF